MLYIILGGFIAFVIFLAIFFRVVVRPNFAHIVQRRSKTTLYGKGYKSNAYYKWPSWLPFFGVVVRHLPVSNFDLSLKEYEAYDRDKVPFIVDVTAFFRIEDPDKAAQRVEDLGELEGQLSLIVQGAVRKVLASDLIEIIMLERSKFGDMFTNEVSDQLKEWGVASVKAMELMDIRDGKGSQNVSNIMAKKTSKIDMESRTEVAVNKKKAETAEIEAEREIEVRRQEALETVGRRTAEKDKQVGMAQEQSSQNVLEEKKVTREKDMEVNRVNEVKMAEIVRDKEIVNAEQTKKTTVIVADGNLEAKKKEAEGIEAEGSARAEAEKLMKLAPVMAKIELAKEIGENEGYQQYLRAIESIKAYLQVGSKQAEALKEADVKVISNAGKPTEGVTNVMDLFTTEGGTQLGGMIEAFAQSPIGKTLLQKMGVDNDTKGEDITL